MDRKEIFASSKGIFKVDTLQQRVYDYIKKLILTNKLKPGQEIIIDQLASNMGISHTPIREALAMLKLDGLVTTGYHKTPKVTDIDEIDIKEIYDVRIILEGYAIQQVINEISNEDVSILKSTVNVYQGKEDSEEISELLAQSDVNLHGLIISKVENSLFIHLYKTIEDMSLRIRTLVIANTAENIITITAEHNAIIEALEQRDVEKAYQAMVSHLSNARERTLNALVHLDLE